MNEKGSETIKRLQSLMEAIVSEARSNQPFASRLAEALDTHPVRKARPVGTHQRRRPAVLNPFGSYERSEEELGQALEKLTLDQLNTCVGIQVAHGIG